MSKNYLLGFSILFLAACGGSGAGPTGSSGPGATNSAPVISSGNTYSVAENTTAIGTVTATDADGDSLAYFIQGDDSSLVTLTGNTLTFNAAPDFEAPADANSDNVYEVTVVVSDGSAKDAKDLSISVTNVNEGPQLLVNSAYTVEENTMTVATATVSDSTGDVTFSLSGTDASAMTIGASSGVLAFAANPDFEAPADADGDNVYNVTVTAADSAGANSADVAVTVTDVLECTGACDLFISEYAEGSSHNKYLEIANFTGADVSLDNYVLANASNGGADGSYDYWNNEIFAPGDVIADGDVYVVAQQGGFGDADQKILDRADATHGYLSNGDDGYALVKGTQDSFVVVDLVGDWGDDPGSGWDVCGVTDATKDHTLVKKEGKEGSSDWAASAGTNADDCDWIVAEKDAFILDTNPWDGLGSHCYDSSNDSVTFTSDATFSVAENSTAVGTVAAGVAGCNSGDTVTMTLSGADAALFTIDAAGALAFAAAPDFEAPGSASGTNDYTVVVTATAGSISADQTITVTVTDVAEADPTKADFSGSFAGAVVDGDTYTFPTGADAWAGFANNNAALYPFTFPNGGTVTFTAAAPSGDVNVNFRFERLPWPDVDPAFNTANVTISGTDEKTYSVDFEATGENTYSSLIMYIVERDIPVVVKDVAITAKPAGVVPDFSGTFDGTVKDGDTYSWPAAAADWAGFSNDNSAIYPITLSEAGTMSFKGSAPDGDVDVRFRFERMPWPNVDPAFETAVVTVSGADVKDYSVDLPAQGDKTFESLLLYVMTRDVGVVLTDFSLVADPVVDSGNGGGVLDMNEAFGGFVIGDAVTAGTVTGPTYTWPTGDGVFSWAGVAHDPTKTDVYPMKFPNGGTVVAKMAALTGTVDMRFKAEESQNSATKWESGVRTISADGDTYTFTIPATDDRYNNFLLYLNERDKTLVVESVEVIPND